VKKDINKWTSNDHVQTYLAKTRNLPHQEEIKNVLLEQIPTNIENVLDLGTGDGKLLALVKQKNPQTKGVAIDFSEPMLKLVKQRFAEDKTVQVIKHDLNKPLPTLKLEKFDLVISGLAIHHLNHKRKKQLYLEVFDLLKPEGRFLNLEHVASATESLHVKFLSAVGLTAVTDDPSNKLLDVETQLKWLRNIGFYDVDCYWKWLEVALLAGIKP